MVSTHTIVARIIAQTGKESSDGSSVSRRVWVGWWFYTYTCAWMYYWLPSTKAPLMLDWDSISDTAVHWMSCSRTMSGAVSTLITVKSRCIISLMEIGSSSIRPPSTSVIRSSTSSSLSLIDQLMENLGMLESTSHVRLTYVSFTLVTVVLSNSKNGSSVVKHDLQNPHWGMNGSLSGGGRSVEMLNPGRQTITSYLVPGSKLFSKQALSGHCINISECCQVMIAIF